MAQQAGTNPEILDAVGQSIGQTLVGTIVWQGVTSGDTLTLLDASGGNTILNVVAPSNNYILSIRVGGVVNGIYVQTLGSGKVFVFKDTNF